MARLAEIEFAVVGTRQKVQVRTARPELLYGAAFIALGPGHPLVKGRSRSAQDEMLTGMTAQNPLTGEHIPVLIDVSVSGTAARAGTPAHDLRDRELAGKLALPVSPVYEPETGIPQADPEFRRSIVAIVRDPEANRFLSINWGDLGGNLFIGGGREEGESPEAAARREVAEETGYTHLKSVAQTGRIHHHYFAHSKHVARLIEAHGILFDLTDKTAARPQLEADEQGKFVLQWLTPDEVQKHIIEELHATCYALLVKGQPFSGEGIMINAGPHNGQKTAKARQVIMADLQRKHTGKWLGQQESTQQSPIN